MSEIEREKRDVSQQIKEIEKKNDNNKNSGIKLSRLRNKYDSLYLELGLVKQDTSIYAHFENEHVLQN